MRRTRVVITKKSQADRNVRQRATRRVRREDRHSMSSALLMRLKFCQIDSRTFQKKPRRRRAPGRRRRCRRDACAPSGSPSSSCLALSSCCSPRRASPSPWSSARVGVGHRPRITDGADAAELQGLWSALELRPRLSSSSFLPPKDVPPRPDEEQYVLPEDPGGSRHVLPQLSPISSRTRDRSRESACW